MASNLSQRPNLGPAWTGNTQFDAECQRISKDKALWQFDAKKKNDSVNLGISGTGQILRSSLAIQLWAFFETPNPYQPDVALVLSDRKARFKFSLRCAELGCWHSSPEFIGAVGPWTGKVDNMLIHVEGTSKLSYRSQSERGVHLNSQ